MDTHIVFVGLSGYDYPHTRVRCYNFADQLNTYPGITASVVSLRDHCSSLSEVEIYQAGDRQKLQMLMRQLPKVFPKPRTWFYLQKAHYNSAVPYLFSRLGFSQYFFDYDDYDVDLNVTFNRKKLCQFFYGARDDKTITENLAKNALGCVAASHSLYDYVKTVNKNVEYVPTGVRLDRFDFVSRQDHSGPVRFIWTGIVWGDEIFESVLRSFKGMRAVKQANLDARLELVGGGLMWDEMDKVLNSDYGDIVDMVDVTGWTHPDEMPKLLARADIGLLPFSADSMWVRSKSPTKLFEYLATGLPVIADAIGEVKHVITHNESGFLAEDQKDFNACMVALAGDRNMRLRMGNLARKRIEHHFSIPVIVDRLYRFIDRSIRTR